MTRQFALGFIIGLLIFLVVNLISAHLASDCGLLAVFGRAPCADDIARAGLPLQFLERGGFDNQDNFRADFLVIDLIIGVLLASTLGWLAARRSR